jgi:hypothetical protein
MNYQILETYCISVKSPVSLPKAYAKKAQRAFGRLAGNSLMLNLPFASKQNAPRALAAAASTIQPRPKARSG